MSTTLIDNGCRRHNRNGTITGKAFSRLRRSFGSSWRSARGSLWWCSPRLGRHQPRNQEPQSRDYKLEVDQCSPEVLNRTMAHVVSLGFTGAVACFSHQGASCISTVPWLRVQVPSGDEAPGMACIHEPSSSCSAWCYLRKATFVWPYVHAVSGLHGHGVDELRASVSLVASDYAARKQSVKRTWPSKAGFSADAFSAHPCIVSLCCNTRVACKGRERLAMHSSGLSGGYLGTDW